MTPLSRALEQFDERKHNWREDFDFWEDDIKDFITDFYRQILTEDIERLDKKVAVGSIDYMQGRYDAIEAEITHKKQLLEANK